MRIERESSVQGQEMFIIDDGKKRRQSKQADSKLIDIILNFLPAVKTLPCRLDIWN